MQIKKKIKNITSFPKLTLTLCVNYTSKKCFIKMGKTVNKYKKMITVKPRQKLLQKGMEEEKKKEKKKKGMEEVFDRRGKMEGLLGWLV